MKKIFPITLLSLFLIFVSCENTEDIENPQGIENTAIGNWNVSQIIVLFGTTEFPITPDNFEQYLSLIPEDNQTELENVMNGSITFNADSTYSTSIYGDTITGTYSLNDNEGTLNSTTEEELNFSINTEKDPYEISSTMHQEDLDFTVYLTKQ